VHLLLHASRAQIQVAGAVRRGTRPPHGGMHHRITMNKDWSTSERDDNARVSSRASRIPVYTALQYCMGRMPHMGEPVYAVRRTVPPHGPSVTSTPCPSPSGMCTDHLLAQRQRVLIMHVLVLSLHVLVAVAGHDDDERADDDGRVHRPVEEQVRYGGGDDDGGGGGEVLRQAVGVLDHHRD